MGKYNSNLKTVNYGLDMLRYLGSKIWQLVPREIREITSRFIHPKDKKSGFLKIVPADSVSYLYLNWTLYVHKVEGVFFCVLIYI